MADDELRYMSQWHYTLNTSSCSTIVSGVIRSLDTCVRMTSSYSTMQYTGSPDAEGTLGGLVQQARHLEDHLAQALRMSALC